MIITQKNFNIFVIVIVMLTGAGFGFLIGLCYTPNFSWIGLLAGNVSSIYLWIATIAGTASSYPLAKMYLKQLRNISAKRYSRKKVCSLSTIVAVICGVICTTLIHGIMTLLIVFDSEVPFQMGWLWVIVISVYEIIGALAGLIVGGICSLIYVTVNGRSIETV